ncbi:MAG: preprotein translocase subunit SecG [Lentisphaeria bacterium]|nr:preprotein translocase subunit SecG [Lentisphaeria bacterium]
MFLSVLNVIIYALIVIIAFVLVILILIQPSKSGGLGAAFGGAGENVFGAHALDHVSKLTVWLIAIFFALTLALTVISAHSSPDSLMGDAESDTEEVQPAPAAAAEEVKKIEVALPEQPVTDVKAEIPAAGAVEKK